MSSRSATSVSYTQRDVYKRQPHTAEEKEKGAAGMVGLETAFGVCYTKLCREQRLPLELLSFLMSAGPAAVLGLADRKGMLEPGYDADVVLADLYHMYAVSYTHLFITICTQGRQQILWESDTFTEDDNVGASIARPQRAPTLSKTGKVVEQCIWEIPAHYPHISVEKYAVMPNHIHLLLLIQREQDGRPMVAPTVSTVMQQFKGIVSKQLSRPIWQKSFHCRLYTSL